MPRYLGIAVMVALLNTSTALAQQVAAQHSQHESHAAGVDRRGDQGMGFSHLTSTHHFLLRRDGGVIQAQAIKAGDQATIASIRQHSAHIAKAFAAGDFELPGFIHDREPPGVATMKALRGQIRYRFRSVDRGAEVVIQSSNAKAVAAVHDFLRFQIADHRTGDSTAAP